MTFHHFHIFSPYQHCTNKLTTNSIMVKLYHFTMGDSLEVEKHRSDIRRNPHLLKPKASMPSPMWRILVESLCKFSAVNYIHPWLLGGYKDYLGRFVDFCCNVTIFWYIPSSLFSLSLTLLPALMAENGHCSTYLLIRPHSATWDEAQDFRSASEQKRLEEGSQKKANKQLRLE